MSHLTKPVPKIIQKKTKKKKAPTQQQLVEKKRKRCVVKAKEKSKERDNYCCRYCGIGKPHGKQVHSHHIFHEGSHKEMSADLDNLITLCASHHQSFAGSKYAFSFHGCPTESTEWLRENWPNYEELRKRSLKTQHSDMIFWDNKWSELTHIE